MRKNIQKTIICTIILIFTIILFNNQVKASEIEKRLNILYRNWSQLENKQNYIQPAPITIDYEANSTTYKNSDIGRFANLRTAYQNKYKLNGLTVRDQQDTSECWAVTITTTLESNLLKLNSKTDQYSPRHMDYYTSRNFLNNKINPRGFNREGGKGGNFFIGLAYYTSGAGPVLEKDMPFENNEDRIDISKIQNKKTQKSVKEYVRFPSIYKEYNGNSITYTNGIPKGNEQRKEYTKQQVNEIRDLVKTHIITYGAVATNTFAGKQESLNYYNIEKIQNGQSPYYSYYCNKQDVVPDHSVTIVGWDDNYSAENFNNAHKPTSNGAWIILNSYGERSYSNGYMYISYEDALVEAELVGIRKTTDINYDNIYQHDEFGMSYSFIPTDTEEQKELNNIYAANVFKKASNNQEKLTEISFELSQPTNVSVYANLNGKDLKDNKFIENIGTLDAGYHTYTLKTPQKITGNEFAVILQYKSDKVDLPVEMNYYTNTNGQISNIWDVAKSEPGQSFVSTDGTNWQDLTTILHDSNVCIKAFTVNEKSANIKVTNLELTPTQKQLKIGEMATLTATILPKDATNKKITWSTENKQIATVTQEGVVTAIGEGTTNIKATTADGAITKSCKIIVTKKAENTAIKVKSIKLSQNSKTIKIGEKFKLTATILPENATNKEIVWSSTDAKIATVDNNGNVTGISEGKVTITATNKANNISESCVVAVVSQTTPPKSEDENKKNEDKPITIKPNSNSVGSNQQKPTQDNTTSKNLPKTGISAIIIIAISTIITIGTFSFIKYKKSQIK